VSPGGCSSLPGNSSKNPESRLVYHASPGGTMLTTRRLLSGTQKTSKNWMSRLAIVHRPLGGFSKIPETRIIHRALYMHQFSHTVHEINMLLFGLLGFLCPFTFMPQEILAKRKLYMVLPRFEPMTMPMPTQYTTI